MSAVQHFILSIDHDPDEADRIAQATSTRLQSKETSLVQVVESLGEYINDESDSTRSKAVKFLTQIIKNLPTSFLSRQQIQVLCHFLCDRIEDDGAVQGLTALSKLSRLTAEMTIMIFRVIHERFTDLQSKPQSKRFEIVSLLNILMTQHRMALRGLGTESLVGLVDLFAGEKDPRNLMVAFSVFRVVIAEWDIASQVETLFDAVFCYFPITFRPPPNDPYGITAQDLKQRLKDCISASDLFAPHAFPQLLQKLDAHSINARRDVLDTLCACAASYSPHTMSTYSVMIWDALKFEVFNAQEEELGELALSMLQTTARRLKSVDGSPAHLTTYLQPIANDCNDKLKEPQSVQAQPAASIVGSLGLTSQPALALFARSCIPPLLKLYRDAENFEMRRAILDVISEILRGATELQDSDGRLQSPLAEFSEALFEIFSQALMSTAKDETSFRLSAMKCLTLSCKCPNFLDSGEIGMVIQYLDEIVLADAPETKAVLRDQAIDGLSTVSKAAPNQVSDIALPAFMARLPDSAEISRATYAILDSVSRLNLERSLSGTLLRRLFNKAKSLVRIQGASQYLRGILATVYLILGKQDLKEDPNLRVYFENIIELVKGLSQPMQEGDSITVTSEPMLTVMLGRLTGRILRSMGPQAQGEASQELFALLSNATQSTGPFDLALGEVPHSNARILLTYMMAALRREVPLPINDDQLILMVDQLMAIAQYESDPIVRLNMLQQMALILNKFISQDRLAEVERRLWSPETGLFIPKTMTKGSIRTGFWIAKGLVLRLSKIDEILTRLLDLAADGTHGMDIGLGFEILLCPDEILAKENGAVIRLLSSQKIFDLCLADVSARLRKLPAAVKPNYIVALSGVLKFLNPDIITPRADELLPLLLQALDLSNPSVKEAAVHTLTTLVKTSPEAVESHAPSLINRLLSAATDCNNDMVKVRDGALGCLEIFPATIKTSALIPYRRAALKGMLCVLDDPRRQIRKKAVDCRTAWLNLDEPEEE